VCSNLVEVHCSERIFRDWGCGNAEFIEATSTYGRFSVLPKAWRGSASDFSWLRAEKVDRAHARKSAPITAVCIPATKVFETLIVAAQAQTKIETGNLPQTAIDYAVIHHAWNALKGSFPALVQQAICNQEENNPGLSSGQVVIVVLEKVGRISSQGARGKLNGFINKHSADDDWINLPLEFGRRPCQFSVAQKIASDSFWLVTLFGAFLSHRGIQVLETRSNEDTKNWLLALMREIQRNSFLNKEF
jgi:hypothetical protein